MLNWLKALFTSDEILKEDTSGEYIPFHEIFTEGFLNVLYQTFEKYINQHVIDEDFHRTIKREVFSHQEFENIQKIMANLNINLKSQELCTFLEQNCYLCWFPMKHAEGHKFTANEKLALAGFAFFQDNFGEEDYPHTMVYQEINEQKKFAHPTFTEKVFEANLPGMIRDYEKVKSSKAVVL